MTKIFSYLNLKKKNLRFLGITNTIKYNKEINYHIFTVQRLSDQSNCNNGRQNKF